LIQQIKDSVASCNSTAAAVIRLFDCLKRHDHVYTRHHGWCSHLRAWLG
jgi:glutathionyl-hydroquinone reductase